MFSKVSVLVLDRSPWLITSYKHSCEAYNQGWHFCSLKLLHIWSIVSSHLNLKDEIPPPCLNNLPATMLHHTNSRGQFKQTVFEQVSAIIWRILYSLQQLEGAGNKYLDIQCKFSCSRWLWCSFFCCFFFFKDTWQCFNDLSWANVKSYSIFIKPHTLP